MLVCLEALYCCLQQAACQIDEPAQPSAGDQHLWLMSTNLWRERDLKRQGENWWIYNYSQSYFIFLEMEKEEGGLEKEYKIGYI